MEGEHKKEGRRKRENIRSRLSLIRPMKRHAAEGPVIAWRTQCPTHETTWDQFKKDLSQVSVSSGKQPNTHPESDVKHFPIYPCFILEKIKNRNYFIFQFFLKNIFYNWTVIVAHVLRACFSSVS